MKVYNILIKILVFIGMLFFVGVCLYIRIEKKGTHYLVKGNSKRALEANLREKPYLVNTRVEGGVSLLHEVSYMGYNDIVKILLRYGADINIRDNRGNPPIFYAVSVGNLETVKLLLLNGADPYIRNKKGEDIIDWAREEDCDKIIEYIIKFRR